MAQRHSEGNSALARSSTHLEKLYDCLSRQPNAGDRCLERPRTHDPRIALLDDAIETRRRGR